MQRSISLFFCRRCTHCLFDIKAQIINSFQYGVSNESACNTTGIQECHTFFSDIIFCVNKANTQSKFLLVRDAPSGGGGLARVFVACKHFFHLREKTIFFWQSTSDNFFLMFRRIKFLSYASPIM